MQGKLEFTIEGTVTVIQRDGETKEQAQNRVAGDLLNMEIQGNAHGDPRFHLSLRDKEGEKNEFDHDNPLSRFKFVDETHP